MPQEIAVVAHFTAREGQTDALRSLLESLLEPTRAEEGCIAYRLHQHTDDDRRFVFYERWASAEALDTHGQTEHIARVHEEGEAYIAESDVQTFVPVS